jgi:CheY-like chemotaxis protein
MDMNLPDIDGGEVTQQIRKREKYGGKEQRLPIIAVTANAMSIDFKKASDAGCDEYEPKPIDFANLLEKMNILLGVDS